MDVFGRSPQWEPKIDPEACCAGNVFAIEHLPALWLVRRGPALSLNVSVNLIETWIEKVPSVPLLLRQNWD